MAQTLAAGEVGMVDHSALKVNQAFIIGLLAVGFVVNQPWLVALVAAVMVIGTAVPQAALFQQIYHRLLKPRGWPRPERKQESPAPHRFAQGMGGAVLLVALLAFGIGAFTPGWGLVLLVITLAAVNLVFGFCAGCFVYFQLARLRKAH